MTIRSDFGLGEVTAQKIKDRFKKRTLEVETETINNSRCVGIEVEVENHQLNETPSEYIWQHVGDGSLRNNGEEWVTTPIAAEDAPKALYELLRVCLSDQCSFGPRTSTHVHINAQDLNQVQVKNIVQLYCVFEKVLFDFVGKNRAKNIYCVPLYDTNLMRQFNQHSLGNSLESWVKYTGLNLLPLREKGTLEFRQMHGSSDPTKLTRWIRILLRLYEFVLSPKMSTKNAFTELMTSLGPDFDFHALLRDVFKEDSQLLPFTGWRDVKVQVTALQQAYGMNNIISRINAQRVVEAPFYQFGVK